MQTEHTIILGNSQQMPELNDSSIHLMVTSPPYPMIKMWDAQFGRINPQIATLWQKLETDGGEETVTQIYDAMHETLARTWRETFRVLVDGGLACINIGDATRTVNGKFRLFPNHSRIIEHCKK
jgi:DNA modification methylase